MHIRLKTPNLGYVLQSWGLNSPLQALAEEGCCMGSEELHHLLAIADALRFLPRVPCEGPGHGWATHPCTRGMKR